MIYKGKLYKIKHATLALQLVFEQKLKDYMATRYSPLRAFAEGLTGMPEVIQEAAIREFVAARRDIEYPDALRIEAQNTLEAAQFLVSNLIPDCDFDVTEENKGELLRAIQIHHNDPDLEYINDIRGMRNEIRNSTE